MFIFLRNKKKILTIPVLTLFMLPNNFNEKLLADDEFTIDYTQLIGSGSNDYLYDIEYSSSDSAIYGFGFSMGTINSIPNIGSRDALLTKYSSLGEEIWTRTVGSTSLDQFQDGALFSDFIYGIGFTAGDLDSQDNSGDNDAFITQFDNEGNKNWTKLLGTSADDRAQSVITLSDGSIIISGMSRGDIGGTSNRGNYDSFVSKYDSNGNLSWTQNFGSASEDQILAITKDSDDNIYVTGFTSGLIPDSAVIGGGKQDIHISKINSSGEKIWTNEYGSSGRDVGKGIAFSSDGSIYVTGYVGGEFANETAYGSRDMNLTKFDSNGNLKWTKTLGGENEDYGEDILVASDGSIYVVGQIGHKFGSSGIETIGGETSIGKFDIHLSKLFLQKYQLFQNQKIFFHILLMNCC